MERLNFMALNLCVSGMVALSAYFTERFIRCSTYDNVQQNIIVVPDSFFKKDSSKNIHGTITKKTYLAYFLMTLLFFAVMTQSVFAIKHYPQIMIIMQHFSVLLVILLTYLQFSRPCFAVPLAFFCFYVWSISMGTNYRWMLNNVVVFMTVLLSGYFQFKNFATLQLFMWLAFVYDVFLLAGYSSLKESLFSFSTDAPVVNKCDTLLCTLLDHHNNYQLPTVFTMQLGAPEGYICLGSGDVVIGSLVTNFSYSFFKTQKHLLGTVLAFSFAVAVLSHVPVSPFPALMTIVPICTFAVVCAAMVSRRSRELISGCHSNFDTCAA